jgi:hypothetical protein
MGFGWVQEESSKRKRRVKKFITESDRARCDICHQPCSRGGNLSQNHDHKTGVKRGKLCRSCNPILGLAKNDAGTLRLAAEYLVKWHQRCLIYEDVLSNSP